MLRQVPLPKNLLIGLSFLVLDKSSYHPQSLFLFNSCQQDCGEGQEGGGRCGRRYGRNLARSASQGHTPRPGARRPGGSSRRRSAWRWWRWRSSGCAAFHPVISWRHADVSGNVALVHDLPFQYVRHEPVTEPEEDGKDAGPVASLFQGGVEPAPQDSRDIEIAAHSGRQQETESGDGFFDEGEIAGKPMTSGKARRGRLPGPLRMKYRFWTCGAFTVSGGGFARGSRCHAAFLPDKACRHRDPKSGRSAIPEKAPLSQASPT